MFLVQILHPAPLCVSTYIHTYIYTYNPLISSRTLSFHAANGAAIYTIAGQAVRVASVQMNGKVQEAINETSWAGITVRLIRGLLHRSGHHTECVGHASNAPMNAWQAKSICRNFLTLSNGGARGRTLALHQLIFF